MSSSTSPKIPTEFKSHILFSTINLLLSIFSNHNRYNLPDYHKVVNTQVKLAHPDLNGTSLHY
jgi:hypothetical protein